MVVPSTLRGVLQARLDALAPAERAVLQRASVVGRVFWDDAVQPALADPRDGRLRRVTLDELRRRELVFEREVSAFDAAREFLFKHALLRDVAYDGVLRTHRQRYHARAAGWLSEVSGRSGREDEYAALIAEHYDRAGDPAAGPWYFRAGRQAPSVYALTEADRLLRRALDLVTDDPVSRFDVLATREHDARADRGQGGPGPRPHRDGGAARPVRGPRPPRRLPDLPLPAARSALSRYDEAEEWAEQAAGGGHGTPGLDAEAAEAMPVAGQVAGLARRDRRRAPSRAHPRPRPSCGAPSAPRRRPRRSATSRMLANNEGRYAEALDLVVRARDGFRRPATWRARARRWASRPPRCST